MRGQLESRVPFNAGYVARLADSPSGDQIVWDGALPGFGVRRRGAKVTYVVQYRVGRQQRRETLGDIRKLTLSDARKAAQQRFAKAVLGIDPVAEKTSHRSPGLRFDAAFARYLEAKKPALRASTWKAAKRYFNDYWRPLHGLAVGKITHARVAEELTELLRKRGRTGVARARANLAAFFTWAMGEGLAPSNPVIATNDPAAGLPARERVLDHREIALIWNACRDDDFGRIVKLLMLTACRRDEIGGLSWSEIGATEIVLPAERTKASRSHVIPLSDLAMSVIDGCSRKVDRDLLFGTRGGAFSRWSWEKMALDKRIAEAGQRVAPWHLHDLRRTAATMMAELGVLPHVIEAVLNHAIGGRSARVYNRYLYRAEKLDALQRWADLIAGVVMPKTNVAWSRSS